MLTDNSKRLEQIRAIIIEHHLAEESNDVERTMRTYAPDAVFEAPHKLLTRREEIAQQYEERFKAFPGAKRIIKRLMVDETGAFAEVLVEGDWREPYQGLPPRPGRQHNLTCCHFEVNAAGLITRKVSFYDRLEASILQGILPDIDRPLGRVWLAVARPQLLIRIIAYRVFGLKL